MSYHYSNASIVVVNDFFVGTMLSMVSYKPTWNLLTIKVTQPAMRYVIEITFLVCGKNLIYLIANFLFNAYEREELEKLQFIKECNDDPKWFKKSIKNNKICIRISEESTEKWHERSKIKIERDILERLFALSLQLHVGFETCISFPIAPVPPALFL